jgi:hypothetical protein
MAFGIAVYLLSLSVVTQCLHLSQRTVGTGGGRKPGLKLSAPESIVLH